MARLTNKYWRRFAPWECCGRKHCCHGDCIDGCIVPKVYELLAAYEDIGLDPEDIKSLLMKLHEPLSLEQLRELDGEPVWVQPVIERGGWWSMVQLEKERCQSIGNSMVLLQNFSTYGKRWLAYRVRQMVDT